MGKSHDLATMASDGFAFPSTVTITKPSNAELVTNGDFSNGTTGWTASGATLSVSNGQLTVADNGGYTKAYQGVTTVVNQTYTLSVTQVSVTGQSSVIGLSSAVPTGNTWGNMISFAKTSGDLPHTQTYTFKATGTTTYISIGSEGTNSAVFDNVSLKEVGLPDNQILTAGDLTTELSNLGIEVTASGIVTKPNQPSFTAHRQVDQDITSSNTNVNLIFDAVDHNIGNHYSTSTGKFTCPVSGVYFISFSIRLDFLGGTYAWCYPFVNGSPRYDAGGPNFITTDTGSYTTLAAAGQLSLSANDYVQIYVYVAGDSDWDFENASFFSMRLMG